MLRDAANRRDNNKAMYMRTVGSIYDILLWFAIIRILILDTQTHTQNAHFYINNGTQYHCLHCTMF